MHTLRYYINLIKESELIEPKVTTQQVKNLDVDKLEKFQRKNTDYDKSGLFAYARDVDPHQIKLTSYKPELIEDDPKYQYIQKIKPLMGENPYVPNVYEIKLVTAKNLQKGEVKPTYVMQKLLNFKDVPVLSLYAVVEQLMEKCPLDQVKGYAGASLSNNTQIVNHLYDSVNQLILRGKAEDPIGDPGNFWSSDNVSSFKSRIIYLITDYLTFLYDGEITCTDKNLIQVINIVKQLAQDPKFNYDLHEDNIMFRSTPYGYQLVITDPIANMTNIGDDDEDVDNDYDDMYNFR